VNEAVKAGQFIGSGISVVWGIVVTLGASKMKSLESRGSAMMGSIVAMIPCNPCFLLGLPFGIWALVALNKPEVKDVFR
jgi:hypothetical protein